MKDADSNMPEARAGICLVELELPSRLLASNGGSLEFVEISCSRRDEACPPLPLSDYKSISDVSMARLTSSSCYRIFRSWRLNSEGTIYELIVVCLTLLLLR